MRPRLRTEASVLPQRWHKSPSRPPVVLICLSVSELGRMAVGRDLALLGVTAHFGALWFRVDGTSPRRLLQRLLGSAWVDGGRDGSSLCTPLLAGTRERRPQPPRFHGLRHTGNTLAASTGTSTRELMARMGHSTARAALICRHASAERDRLIADAVSGLVDKGRKKHRKAKKKQDRKPKGHEGDTGN